VRYQAALRPDIYTALLILNYFHEVAISSSQAFVLLRPVANCYSSGFSTEFCSFAIRFNFTKASRFICSFIREYFLKTLASPCRRNCVPKHRRHRWH
jgi:hypothetical protein